jgi:hypothetical protein
MYRINTIHRMFVRRLTLPLVSIAVLLGAQGCGFLEAAGEITIGEGQIARVQTDLQWPPVQEVLGDQVGAQATGDAPGFPTDLADSTMAHVQGLMNIDGECRRTSTVAQVAGGAAQLRNLTVEIINCGSPDRCTEYCEGFRGMKMSARVQFQLLDEEKAKKIRELLSDKTSPDAIVAIRGRFTKLLFYQLVGGVKEDIGQYFETADFGLSSEGGGDDTVLIAQRYLARISAKTPQRFAFDNRAEFTIKTKQGVIAAKTMWIEIFQRFAIPQEHLYSVQLSGGGVELDFQPEFVISALEVAKGQL